MLTIEPPFPRVIRSIASRLNRKTLRTLTAKISSHSRTVVSTTVFSSCMAALLTRISRPPRRSLAVSTTLRACTSEDTSPATQWTEPLSERLSGGEDCRAVATTLAPSATKRSTIALPMPLDAPVTMASLPSSLPPISTFSMSDAIHTLSGSDHEVSRTPIRNGRPPAGPECLDFALNRPCRG